MEECVAQRAHLVAMLDFTLAHTLILPPLTVPSGQTLEMAAEVKAGLSAWLPRSSAESPRPAATGLFPAPP